ncbi:MAG: T9SS type A sorting domain-containing protein [Draconibacterium sp.]
MVADPKYFAIRLIGTDNNVSYAKVIGGWVYNCDGIAAFARSTVSKCFIWANDDAIKAYRDSISWSDIVVWQLNNGGTIQMSWGGAVGGSTAKGVTISRLDVLRAEWDVDRFNVGLLNCVGNHYQEAGRSDLLENWLIEDVVTETAIPLIWNITPDPYTHCHIHGLTMKDWTVFKDNSLGFVNEIKGEDPNDFFSGFVFDNVRFNNGLLTNENRIASGEMDNGNWVSVSNGTDHTTTFCSTCGTGSGWGLLSKTTNMNGKLYYTNVCQDEFHIDNNEMITISYWARATATGKLLTPFVQDVVTGDMKEFPQVSLTTNFTRYASTVQVDKSTSGRYKVKFRGFSTAWIYLDKVQVGRKDWITLTGIEKQYLNTPTFLPALKSAKLNTGIAAIKKEFEVYPNPVSDVLFINETDENIRYKVLSQTGSLLLSGQGNRVEVSNLKPGMYILVTDDYSKIKFVKL